MISWLGGQRFEVLLCSAPTPRLKWRSDPHLLLNLDGKHYKSSCFGSTEDNSFFALLEDAWELAQAEVRSVPCIDVADVSAHLHMTPYGQVKDRDPAARVSK